MSHSKDPETGGLLSATRERWNRLPAWQKWTSGLVPFTALGVLSFNVTAGLIGGDDTTTETSPSPSTHINTAGNVLAVKIDNVKAARPSTGVQAAKVVYVEQVESGLTRLMAVYGANNLPSRIGPVRSAREADLDILKEYGHAGFAYSGATSTLIPIIRSADVLDFEHGQTSWAYSRSSSRPAPHNLYLSPSALRLHDAPDLKLTTSEPPKGGEKNTLVRVKFPAATYSFQWTGRTYSVYMDGYRASNTDTGNSYAHTVIVQDVEYKDAVHGSKKTPYAQTIGSGDMEMYRNGMKYEGKWERDKGSDKTKYLVNGKQVYPDSGQTWILLK